MAAMICQIAQSSRSLTREIIYDYLKVYYPLDIKEAKSRRTWVEMQNKCHRAIHLLERLGLVETFSETFFRGHIHYVVASLTPHGKEYCQIYGWEPVKSDWEILKEGHQGETQRKHSMAIMLFAMHARARGWEVTMVPKATGENSLYSASYDPDLKISKDQIQAFVEVETRKADKKTTKWQIGAAAQRFIAICTMTPARRISLEKEILAANVRCLSTDFRYLNYDFNLNPLKPGDLWVNNMLHPDPKMK